METSIDRIRRLADDLTLGCSASSIREALREIADVLELHERLRREAEEKKNG